MNELQYLCLVAVQNLVVTWRGYTVEISIYLQVGMVGLWLGYASLSQDDYLAN